MGEQAAASSVYLYEFGEAHDDLRAAFFIDERAYSDEDLAQSAVESAEAAMTRAGVIYEVEVTSGASAIPPAGVPTWEEFKQRHFVEGVPLPVRPRPAKRVLPPSWQSMIAAVEEAHHSFRAELENILTSALPDSQAVITSDPGPMRRSPGSVDWSEEKFGFEVTVSAALGDTTPAKALDSIIDLLKSRGWRLSEPVGGTSIGAEQHLFTLWVEARPLKVVVLGQSPLYRSPAEAGTAFVVEPR